MKSAASYYERARTATLLLPEKDQADLPNILYNMANNLYQLSKYREGSLMQKRRLITPAKIMFWLMNWKQPE